MSTGLMSCVRENSPPLEMATAATEPSGTASLSPSVTSSEQTKRRRFHPLRNLRRIFRRRTLTSPIGSSSNDAISASSTTTTQSNSTTPTHNSSSVLLERTIPNLTLSSPSSPATNSILPPYSLMKSPTVPTYSTSQQQEQSEQQQQTVPALSSQSQSIKIHQQQLHQQQQTSVSRTNIGMSERSPIGGVKILPTSVFPLNFSTSTSSPDHFYHHQKSPTSSISLSVSPRQCDNKIVMSKSSTPLQLNSNNCSDSKKVDSMEDLDSDTGGGPNDSNRNGEMTDNQRSFSEGRLMDSDFVRDPLSQSHDSVFSESATASSLSIVLKNELFDVLRKRRNRPDTSDEDLGLPRSPATPQRKELGGQKASSNAAATSTTNSSAQHAQNQSEISSLSLLSAGSSDIDDEMSSNYGGDSTMSTTDRTMSSSMSSSMKILQSSTTFESSRSWMIDDFDFSTTDGVQNHTGRLSHSAAKHKMAIRPKKNKGPTRHRRIESTILPSTPEVNEDSHLRTFTDLTNKEKSRSLPHGVNPKLMHQQNDSSNILNIVSQKETNIKRSKTEKGSPPSNSYYFRNITKSSTAEKDLNIQKSQSETGFFKRFLHRGSKGKGSPQSGQPHNIGQSVDEIDDNKFERSRISEEMQKDDISMEYSKQVEQTRNEIRREMSEANTGLSLMLNNFILSKSETNTVSMEKPVPSPTKPILANKPKSGPAARQRIMPKDLTVSPNTSFKTSSEKTVVQQQEDEMKKSTRYRFSDSSDGSKGSTEILKLSNISLSTSPDFKYTSRGSQMNSSTEEVFRSDTCIRENTAEHYEKHHTQLKTTNLYQHKMHKSENLLDNLLDTPKQRKSVEKSKSFRLYNGSNNLDINSSLQKSENMPSLPDLSFCRKSFEDLEQAEEASISLGFEINDNNLINTNVRHSTSQEDTCALRQGIYTKNIILTTMNPKQTKNISEIEESIDKLLDKSPSQVIVRKSSSTNEALSSYAQSHNVSVTHMYRKTSPESNFAHSDAIKTPSASISIRSDASKPIKISNQLSATNAKDNRKSLIEISKYNDAETFSKSSQTLMSKSLDSKQATESVLSSAKLLINKGSQQNLKTDKQSGYKEQNLLAARSAYERSSEVEKENRKSIDLDEIKKVFTPKYESAEKLNPILRRNSRDELKESVSPVSDKESKPLNKAVRPQTQPADKPTGEKGVPEFMKIQLNKVAEPSRPKTNVVLSKLIKPAETDRRQSTSPPETPTSESRPTSADNKPPLPPISTELEKKRNSYVASIQDSSNSPASKSVTSRLRKSFEEEELVVLRSPNTNEKSQSSAVSPKFERRKSVNDEKIKYERKIEELQKVEKHATVELRKSAAYDDNSVHNTTTTTSTTSTLTAAVTPANTTPVIPAAVLMRKKSLSLGNQIEKTKDDSTPELMKVFARRSLKIKDEDIQAFVDESLNEPKPKVLKTAFLNGNGSSDSNSNSSSSNAGNLDSDKENQSSSEEKLNRLSTKAEQHHHNHHSQSQSHNQKLTNSGGYSQKISPSQRENNEKNQKTFTTLNNCQNGNSNGNSNSNGGNTGFNKFSSSNNCSTNNNQNSAHSTPTKAFNRFNSNSNSTNTNNSNVNNISNSNNRNSLSTLMSSVNTCNNNNINNNNSNNNNNNNSSSIKSGVTLRTANITQLATPAAAGHNISNSNSDNNSSAGVISSIYNKKINTRHTIGPTHTNNNASDDVKPLVRNTASMGATTIATSPLTPAASNNKSNEVEFKGILQRRAEWEKRVKEAAK